MAWSVSVMLIQELVLVDFFLHVRRSAKMLNHCYGCVKSWPMLGMFVLELVSLEVFILFFFVFGVHCSCIQVTGAKSVSKSVSLL